jgi:hypothetical protein
MDIHPNLTNQNHQSINRFAILGFISGILSLYPICIDMYFIAISSAPRDNNSILGNLFNSHPALSLYFFYGTLPFAIISLILGISALIQIAHREENEKGKLLAILSIVFGSIGFLCVLYFAYFTACLLPFKIPWICVYY